MGLRCSCGVLIPTHLTSDNEVTFLFFQDNSMATGFATYSANVCADRPEIGSITVNFVDTDNQFPNRSFVFSSTIIQKVSCEILDTNFCLVTIQGIGMVTGEPSPMTFSIQFIDRPDPAVDSVIVFRVEGFAQQVVDANFQEEITTFC
jgi:hypothetical protein